MFLSTHQMGNLLPSLVTALKGSSGLNLKTFLLSTLEMDAQCPAEVRGGLS